jgi:hypothetical protein
VRVVPDALDDCGPGLEDGCAMVTELELYSTIDGFENDAVGKVPRGYVDAELATVVSADPDPGHALLVDDASASVHAKLVWPGTASDTKTLEFRVRPLALPNALLVDITGTDASDADVTAYHLAFAADGRLRRYDFATSTWNDVTDPGVLATDAWSHVRIVADAAQATVCIDETAVATFGPSTAGITALSGHGFASSGTASVGDRVLIDDVLFDDRMRDCSIERPSDPPVVGGDTSGGADETGADDGMAASTGTPGEGATSEGGSDATTGSTAGEADTGGCGCASAPRSLHAIGLVALLGLVRRRRHRDAPR